MLQLASATATLVSGGRRFEPRLVREIEAATTGKRSRPEAQALAPLPYEADHVALIKRALYGVTQEGTSVRSFAGAPYKTGGKTGTAQAIGIKANEKYNAAKLDEYQRDHSLYMAFAPLDEPTIALAVVVENAGFGSEAAAPITRRVFDYWISGLWPSDEDMAATQIGKSSAPIGKQRDAKDVPIPGWTSIALSASASAPAPAPVAAAAAGLNPRLLR
jgi:penicillin-binding protein 2